VGVVSAPKLLRRNRFVGRRRSNGLSGIGGLANINPIRTVMGVVADDGYQWHAHARGQSQ